MYFHNTPSHLKKKKAGQSKPFPIVWESSEFLPGLGYMECSLRRRPVFLSLFPHRRNFLTGSSELIRNCCKHSGILWCACNHRQCKSLPTLLPEISCAEYLIHSSSFGWLPFFILMHHDFLSPHPYHSLSWGLIGRQRHGQVMGWLLSMFGGKCRRWDEVWEVAGVSLHWALWATVSAQTWSWLMWGVLGACCVEW